MKRKSSYDSSVTIYGSVNTKGDSVIGSNAKIIPAPEKKKPSLIGILVGIIGLIGSLITIYLFLK